MCTTGMPARLACRMGTTESGPCQMAVWSGVQAAYVFLQLTCCCGWRGAANTKRRRFSLRAVDSGAVSVRAECPCTVGLARVPIVSPLVGQLCLYHELYHER